jgi:hypothetical protein
MDDSSACELCGEESPHLEVFVVQLGCSDGSSATVRLSICTLCSVRDDESARVWCHRVDLVRPPTVMHE